LLSPRLGGQLSPLRKPCIEIRNARCLPRRRGSTEARSSLTSRALGSANDLNTSDLEGVKPFYRAVFGWETRSVDFGSSDFTWFSLPGYGAHLLWNSYFLGRQRRQDRRQGKRGGWEGASPSGCRRRLEGKLCIGVLGVSTRTRRRAALDMNLGGVVYTTYA
jgi:hypothetical protein